MLHGHAASLHARANLDAGDLAVVLRADTAGLHPRATRDPTNLAVVLRGEASRLDARANLHATCRCLLDGCDLHGSLRYGGGADRFGMLTIESAYQFPSMARLS